MPSSHRSASKPGKGASRKPAAAKPRAGKQPARGAAKKPAKKPAGAPAVGRAGVTTITDVMVEGRTMRLNPATGLAFLVKGPALPSARTSTGKARLTRLREKLPPRGEPNTIERRQGWRLTDQTWAEGGRAPDDRQKPAARCLTNPRDEIVFTMGLPGSGKSSTLKQMGIPDTHVLIDPDEIKKGLPGYDPKHPGLVHEESSQIAEDMFQEALRRGEGRYAVDGTGTNAEKLIRRIRQAQRAGFYTRVVYVRVRLETAIGRNARRERVVPESIIREKAADIETAASLVMPEANCFLQKDND